MGGELGGVVKDEVRFWTEPGGEELGVRTCVRETGEVLRARGETGVGLLRGVVGFMIFVIRFLKDSERAGEEECLGEGVLLEECVCVYV